MKRFGLWSYKIDSDNSELLLSAYCAPVAMLSALHVEFFLAFPAIPRDSGTGWSWHEREGAHLWGNRCTYGAHLESLAKSPGKLENVMKHLMSATMGLNGSTEHDENGDSSRQGCLTGAMTSTVECSQSEMTCQGGSPGKKPHWGMGSMPLDLSTLVLLALSSPTKASLWLNTTVCQRTWEPDSVVLLGQPPGPQGRVEKAGEWTWSRNRTYPAVGGAVMIIPMQDWLSGIQDLVQK